VVPVSWHEVNIRKPEPFTDADDYTYVAEYLPLGGDAAHCWISAGSDMDGQEALDRLTLALKALGLIESADQLKIEDGKEYLEDEPDVDDSVPLELEYGIPGVNAPLEPDEPYPH